MRRRHQARADALELLASGSPLADVLTAIVRALEEETPGWIASVLLLDDQDRLHVGAAPGLPNFYNQAVEGLAIGEGVGSCGTAAYRKQRVVVADVECDPLWAPYRELAARAGLAACWSEPILGAGGRVLGTFAIYHRVPHMPTEADFETLGHAAHLARIAIERHRADEVVRESEARFRQLADAAPVLIWMVDAEGQAVYTNRRWLEFTGRRPEELLGDGWLASVHADDRAAAEAALRQAVADRQPLRGECCLCRSDGEYRWMLAHAEPRFQNGHNFLGLVGTLTDLTDRRAAEEALHKSERQLRLLSEAQRGFIRGESAAKVWSSLLEGLLEQTASEYGFIGEILHDDRGPYLKTHIITDITWDEPTRRLLESSAATGLEFHNLSTLFGAVIRTGEVVIANHPAGDPRRGGLPAGHPPLRAFLGLPFFSGAEMVGCVGLANRPGGYDAPLVAALEPFLATCATLITALRTARHEAEAAQALQRSRDHFRRLIADTPVAVAMFDRQMNVLAWSRRWLADYRLGGRDLREVPFAELFRQPPQQLAAALPRCLAGGVERCEEDIFAHADGAVEFLRWQCQPWFDDASAVGGLILFTEFITERKRAEEERRALEEKLRETQKLESLGVLAGGIAHDFNNLLTSVLGYAGLSREVLPDNSPVCRYLDEIARSSERAADLCRQLLAYAGKGKFVVGPIDLSHLVQDAARLLGLSVGKKGSLFLKLAPDLPCIDADATQLRQVVMNLVLNAAEALGEEAGSVTVTTSLAHADRTALDVMLLGKGCPAGDYVCLEVTDTGCGMDEVTLARIFEPFFTTKFTGRGLGLAAVLGIMRAHHGALRVNSRPGRGSSFRLLFPPTAAAAALPPPPAPDVPPAGQGTILVVEDEESVRSLLAALLKTAGFSTLLAGDGLAGLELLRQHRAEIRAVLLDLTMPRLDGRQAFSELRRLAPHLPIILMSGFTEEEVRARFNDDSPADFLQKPFSRDDLLAKLSAVLR